MAGESGNVLGNYQFTDGESKEVNISEEETKELSTKGSKCLIGRLGVAKKIHRESFKAILVRIWRTVGNVFFKEIQENLWLFEFSEESDKRRVLEGRPCSYDRTLLILNEFDATTPPSQMDFSFSPIWLQIHDMPLGCMSKGVGFKIGGYLGKVEDVAISADDVGWGKFLRVRVAINLYQPRERGRMLRLSKKSCWVPFRYEKLPVFCYRCGRIIHTQGGCPIPVSKKHDEKIGWGPWIRAEEISCGPVFPEVSRISCSASPAKSSRAAAADTKNLKNHPNMESNQPLGKEHEAVKPSAEISDASSHPCPALNVSPMKEIKTGLNDDFSTGRKRKVWKIPVRIFRA